MSFNPAKPGIHVGHRHEFLDAWRIAAMEASKAPRPLRERTSQAVIMIADKRSLRIAWDTLAKYGGQAPGPDKLRFRDVSRQAAWRKIEELSESITSGTYRHGPVRKKGIAKHSGTSEKRHLSIPNVEDRAVARSAVQILEPLVQFRFDDRSFCRFGKGPFKALATAERLATEEQRWVWISEDLRKAFDEVSLPRLFDVVRQYFPSDDVVSLVQRIVNDRRNKKLYQGSALSPLLMNLYLHHFLDRKWRKQHPDIPLLRYMDDMLVLCRSTDDVDTIYADLRELVRNCGMKLKYEQHRRVIDLKADSITWLGYELRRPADALEITLPLAQEGDTTQEWLDALLQRLLLAHDQHDDAGLTAMQTIEGILRCAGPTLPQFDNAEVYQRIRDVAQDAGFDEIQNDQEMFAAVEAGYKSWLRTREIVAIDSRNSISPRTDGEGVGPTASLTHGGQGDYCITDDDKSPPFDGPYRLP